MSILNKLKPLVGDWKGSGIAEFPTINTFEYSEILFVSMNEKNPVLHFEQKAWIKSNDERNGEPISWESGFLIEKSDNLFEYVCTHNSGRLEWYRGFAEISSDGIINLQLKSVSITNDDRMINSERIFRFSNLVIEYEQLMTTAKLPNSRRHLKAVLQR